MSYPCIVWIYPKKMHVVYITDVCEPRNYSTTITRWGMGDLHRPNLAHYCRDLICPGLLSLAFGYIWVPIPLQHLVTSECPFPSGIWPHLSAHSPSGIWSHLGAPYPPAFGHIWVLIPLWHLVTSECPFPFRHLVTSGCPFPSGIWLHKGTPLWRLTFVI